MKIELRAIIVEGVSVALIGAGVALAANELSPRGLDLARNYFPTNTVAAASIPFVPSTNEPSATEQLTQRLRGKGLQEIKRPEVEARLRDPRALDGRIIFVDARDDDHYAEGHLPGAYQLDPFHPERQLGTVLPAAQAAEEIVVYCTGGECEDADTAAIVLGEAGVPAKKIFVYGGGYTEWAENHLPLETGVRNSGALTHSVK